MPRTKIGLTAAEHAVLGLMQGRRAYGYELQRHFSGDGGLARVCPVEPGMVYAILKSLSGLELIDGEWDSTQYPPKAVYIATPEGEAAFERWLRRPVASMSEVRPEFLVKLYFALRREPDVARELALAQVEVCDQYAADVELEMSAVSSGSFDALVLRSKLGAARGTKEWIEEWLDSPSPA